MPIGGRGVLPIRTGTNALMQFSYPPEGGQGRIFRQSVLGEKTSGLNLEPGKF